MRIHTVFHSACKYVLITGIPASSTSISETPLEAWVLQQLYSCSEVLQGGLVLPSHPWNNFLVLLYYQNNVQSTNLLQNTAKMMHNEKHTSTRFVFNQSSPTFFFYFVSANRFSNKFSPFLHYTLDARHKIVNLEEPVNRILFNFFNHIWKGVLVTCIFKNWLFADWELVNLQNGEYTWPKKPVWCRTHG